MGSVVGGPIRQHALRRLSNGFLSVSGAWWATLWPSC